MCGIVGAIAQRNVAEILLEGLRRLEYRGYDSAGMAILKPGSHDIQRVRALGKVAKLAEAIANTPTQGTIGIAHTRWATHGIPSETNAHPHCSRESIAVVHNGIIENHAILKNELIERGYNFTSDTDSEVIGHLLHHHLQTEPDPCKAIRLMTNELKGAFALGIIINSMPEKLFAIRHGSPLVIGVGIGENFIASDQIALLPITQRFIFLDEGDIAVLETNKIHIEDQEGNHIEQKIHCSELDVSATNKGKYRHFMLKEIYDQPSALTDTIATYVINNKIDAQAFGHNAHDIFKQAKRILIVACGTSYHAGVVAQHWIQQYVKIPCHVEVASEHRYRHVVVEPDTLFITISQSGETADTLAALRQAKKIGYFATLCICNAPESSLARESDIVLLTRAGAEVGVAATKTFTTQLTALLILTIALIRQHNPNDKLTNELTDTLKKLPELITEALKLDKKIAKLSLYFVDKQHALFLGRGEYHAIALEGALKLKEISYMHAEAYPAGELKHGPLALVDHDMPVIVIAPNNKLLDKLKSNIQEVLARGGIIYAISEDHQWENKDSLNMIKMPAIPEVIAPIVYTVPLQLLAYHIAVLKGTDVDQPRNLAKSVTVE